MELMDKMDLMEKGPFLHEMIAGSLEGSLDLYAIVIVLLFLGLALIEQLRSLRSVSSHCNAEGAVTIKRSLLNQHVASRILNKPEF